MGEADRRHGVAGGAQLQAQLPARPQRVPCGHPHAAREAALAVLRQVAQDQSRRLRVRDGIVESARLAAGGVAPVPLFLRQTSEVVEGRTIDRETLALVVATAQSEISPISDVRGSADTKRLLVRNLLVAHFAKAAGIEASSFFAGKAA